MNEVPVLTVLLKINDTSTLQLKQALNGLEMDCKLSLNANGIKRFSLVMQTGLNTSFLNPLGS